MVPKRHKQFGILSWLLRGNRSNEQHKHHRVRSRMVTSLI